MDSELEVIHHEMEETRASLADKLEALESQVRGTVETVAHGVETARETVESTVETVQETVKDTVRTVKRTFRETFDVTGHVRRYPWAMMGGAFAVGFLGGALLGPGRRPSAGVSSWASTAGPSAEGWRSAAAAQEPEQRSAISESLRDGLHLLRGLAVGTVMGLVRDMLVRAVPQNLTSEAARWVDDLTTSLGGKPLKTSSPSGEYNTPKGES